MKITFTTPINNADGTPIDPAKLATAEYELFIDTVNPPVQSYEVPQSLIDSATQNSDGSKTVTVDAAKDLGISVAPATTYYVAAEDNIGGAFTNGAFVGGESSDETAVVAFTTPAEKPGAPGNLQVS